MLGAGAEGERTKRLLPIPRNPALEPREGCLGHLRPAPSTAKPGSWKRVSQRSSLAHMLGIPESQSPAGTAPGAPHGARLQCSAAARSAQTPVRLTPGHARPQPGPAASSPRADSCSPGGSARTCPRGAPTEPRLCAGAPSRDPSAAVRASEGRGVEHGAEAPAEPGRGASGQRWGGGSGGGNLSAQHPQLSRGLSAGRASGIYPWDALYVGRLGEG